MQGHSGLYEFDERIRQGRPSGTLERMTVPGHCRNHATAQTNNRIKDKKNLDTMDTSDSTVKYIPYKESECGEAAGLTAGIAYPENWQEQVGVSYEIKQQRGRVLDAVSSADIRNHGTKVVNPFIGVIPTHGELEDELEQIYEAM